MHAKKVRRGRPPVDTEQVAVRLPRDLLDVLDQVIASDINPKPTSRPDAIRMIVRQWAETTGYIEPPPDREDAN